VVPALNTPKGHIKTGDPAPANFSGTDRTWAFGSAGLCQNTFTRSNHVFSSVLEVFRGCVLK
jgi:hypothetical protein